MPRLTRSTPTYRRHLASGQAIVTLQGRDHYLGRYGSAESKRTYDRIVGEWLAAGRPTSATASPDAVTTLEVLASFKRFAQSHYVKNGKPTGAADTFTATYCVMHSLYGRQPAAEIGPLALKAIIARLIEEGRSRRFISERLQQIKRIFKWAASEELIPFEVYQRLTTVEAPRRGKTKAKELPPVLPVADATVELTLPHLPPVVADMVRLQRYTGARPGEICQLRPADVDRSGEIWKFTPMEHKTEHHGKARVILLGPKAQAVLLRYLARDAEAFCFDPRDSEKKRRAAMHEARKTPMSCGDRPGTNRKRKPKRTAGNRYTNDSYRRAIHRACEAAFCMPRELRVIPTRLPAEESKRRRAEAADWRAKHLWAPNQLRHAAATEVRRLFGIEAAQNLLGHSKLNTTEIYAERDFEKASVIVTKLG
jgi:integrase